MSASSLFEAEKEETHVPDPNHRSGRIHPWYRLLNLDDGRDLEGSGSSGGGGSSEMNETMKPK